MLREPAGQMSPSTYETARLVSLAPWLTGHDERVRHLLRNQRLDGGWGPPEGYALVPTLSATEALLAVLMRSPADMLVDAVDRGLLWLRSWLATTRTIPDTPAIDLIVPALTDAINERLTCRDVPRGLVHWQAGPRLPLPPGMDDKRLDVVRGIIAAGAPVPDKLLHALEVVGEIARDAVGVQPLPPGVIGASPAATAAWLGAAGEADGHGWVRAHLESVIQRHDGLAPCATPLGVFERAWVVGSLARAGIAVPSVPDLVDSLTADLTSVGTPAGPGLPPDADTTSVTLYALARLGVPTDPSSLWRFETDAGFCTWPGEDGFSVTTNAHVLDALSQHVTTRSDATPRYRSAARHLVGALRSCQLPDGSWQDRWHASPYYATVCCTLALADAAPSAAAESLGRAVRWVVATQQHDGSWGRWSGSLEETAYAMQILAVAGRELPAADSALSRGLSYLNRASAIPQEGPALWHDKDLYHPTKIVRAAVLAAQHLATGSRLRAKISDDLWTCPT
ncbi:prenyltransferase [Micromonospora chokoriensis]